MKKGKRPLTFIKNRLPAILLVFCVLICSVVSMVYAKYVKDIDNEVSTNIVGAGEIQIGITKSVTGNTHTFEIKHVTGSRIPAYIRYAVVANWKNAKGDVWYVSPTSMSITIPEGDFKVTQLDGYYYCIYEGKAEIALDTVLSGIEVTTTASAPDGYTFHVQLLVEAIQCVPAEVVTTAWGVVFEDGVWKKKPATP